MEPRSSLAALLTDDEITVGTTLKSMSLNMAEALGYTPVEFFFVDRQHGSPVYEKLEDVVRTSDLNDTPVIVRVPRDDTSLITLALDCGARGIMLPQVESPDTVIEASSHVRYEDGRSLASTSRAARWGEVSKPDYAEYVNNELALLPMIETPAGVEAAGEIAALDEVTALTVGPGDLAWTHDVPFGSDEHQETIDEIFEAAEAQDCPIGIFVGSPEDIDRYRDRAAFVVYSSDVAITQSHFEDVLGE